MLHKIKKLTMKRRSSLQDDNINSFQQSIRNRSHTHTSIAQFQPKFDPSMLRICDKYSSSGDPFCHSKQSTVFHINPHFDNCPPELPPRIEHKGSSYKDKDLFRTNSTKISNVKQTLDINTLKPYPEDVDAGYLNSDSYHNVYSNHKLRIPHQMITCETSLHQNFKLMIKCGWYWGPLRKEEAESKLIVSNDGTFLVRDSSDDRHLLTISFRSMGMTFHTRIEFWRGKFSIFPNCREECYETVPDMINNAIQQSERGVWFYR